MKKTFWLSRPDGWVINKKTKHIIMLEFKRASDTAETYYSDMKSITERQHTHLIGTERPQAPGRRAGMGGGSVGSLYCCQSMRNCSEVIGGKYSDPLVV